jgi:MFS family permease
MNTFWIMRSNEDNRGEYAGLYTIAWSVAQVIAPTAGSMVVTWGGYTLLWEIVTAICMISSLGFLFIYKIDHPLARKIRAQLGYR